MPCPGPNCNRPIVVGGMCRPHYNQTRRRPGEPLTELKPYRVPVQMIHVTIRVPPHVNDAIQRDIPGARRLLSTWAEQASAADDDID